MTDESGSDGARMRLGIAAVLLVVATVLLVSPIRIDVPAQLRVFLEVGVFFVLYALIVLGLNLQYGYTGLVNFGPVGFFLLGGYTAAMLTASDPLFGIGLGYPWPVGLAGAIVVGTLFGGIVGLSAVRLRDDFLAIVTLAAAEILFSLASTFESFTGGDKGILGVPRPVYALIDDSDTTLFVTVVLLAILLVGTYATIQRLSNAPYGRVLRGIRADELATQSLGNDVNKFKISVFVIGVVIMSISGALFAFFNGAVAPGFFTIDVTILVWVGMLLGGAGNYRAAILGLGIVMSFQLLTTLLSGTFAITATQFESTRLLVYGGLLVILIHRRPEGIWGNADELGIDR